MQDKKVTIILPVCNGSKYLEQSIKSCLEQTHKNVELLIIDDFSSDSQIVKTIKSFDDKRIKYYRNKKNMGISYCLNSGFKQSVGDYITWTSDDNFFEKNAIEKMLSYLLERNEKCVYTSFYCLKKDELANKSLVRLYDTSLLARHCFACFLFKREVLEITGLFDSRIFFTPYYDYWLRVSKKFKIAFLSEPLYYFRLHDDSLSSADIRNFKYCIELLLVQYKNGILGKDETVEGILGAGIKYISERARRSFILDFYLKVPLICKPYLKEKINGLFLKKWRACKGFGILKEEIEEMFEKADTKLAEDSFEELKTISCMAISQITDTLMLRKVIKELMKFLLEREMYDIFDIFKSLLSGYIEKDYILFCDISGIEFNYKFNRSEIDQGLILKRSELT